MANVAFKIGGEHVYRAINVGLNPRGWNSVPVWGLGFGVGVRVPIERWYGELEASFDSLSAMPHGGVIFEGGLLSAGARLNVGYQLLDGVAVFAGPQVQLMASYLANRPVAKLSPWGVDVGSGMRVVPGVVVGAEFL